MGNNSKSQKWKEENSFFINPKTNKIQYHKKCQRCICWCKQSFKANVVICPYYTPLPKGERKNAKQ